MVKLCKYPDKDCKDTFYSHSERGQGRRYCRLSEWKRKKGTCPYDKTIKSQMRIKRIDLKAGQRTLNV